ncbi:hypothetical protein LTR66_001205 [Elasticomyces elasticus]|nr:hypothetical protein LTR66_001205 [Elasticomyces elasticus]
MPVPIVQHIIAEGIGNVPYVYTVLKTLPWLVALYLLKVYFGGASNTSERNMHSKVVMVTGGTSGIGQEVVRGLASRGAQIILLTQHPLNDPFLVDYIEDLRTSTSNELITAERVDLESLHSIRTFATKWIDNAPPRRLDMVVLCANTLTPRGSKIQVTTDEVELNWGLNYLANFHLLSILSPALRAQPPDRDVRIIFSTCSSYMGGQLPDFPATSASPEKSSGANGSVTKPPKVAKPTKQSKAQTSPVTETTTTFSTSQAYATSKLVLTTFALSFQKHLSSYHRPDKQQPNTRVILVDPGCTRTPGMRRYLTWGSLTGLFLYLIMYPFWWFVLKSPQQGAQSFLFAAMEAAFGRGEGGWLIKEVREVTLARADVMDESVQKQLWEYSEGMVQEAEKRGAVKRALAKKEEEEREKDEKARREREAKKEEAEKKAGSRRSRKAE